jgi:hypothetical protein
MSQMQMIRTLTRKLRVRDDGTGKSREIDGTFAEFEAEDAIILLGDPGMGKTTFFKDATNANYTTVRQFLIEPRVAPGEAVFLDALDEYRTIAGGQDASSEVAKVLCSLQKPKFRLSCRAADWFGSTDLEALRVASASGRVVVLELSPLSRDEIINAVQGKVQDPVKFLNEAELAGLGKLLGNPQTLELFVRAWESGKRPQNKFEAYEIGVFELLKEANAQHVTRPTTSTDPHDLRSAAGAAASTLLLSNSIGISRSELAEGQGYVRMSVVPYPNSGDLNAVLGRRLFVSPEVDRFELIHRTVAEFLAAEDLSRRIMSGLPIDRVMALICGFDGRPISSLRGLFAWLMCKIPQHAEDYVERDAYGVAVYGDASVLPPTAQCAIWGGLRELRDPWFLMEQDDSGSFRELANIHTVRIIQEVLKDPATRVHLKIAVLEAVANSTQNIGLDQVLRDMVLEKHDNTWLRATALRAFAKSINNDWVQLEALDHELSQTTDDFAAPEVRVDLLRLTLADGSLPLRLLSIIEQAVSTNNVQHRIIGRLYSLIALPSDSDLDEVLDGASKIPIPEDEVRYELRLLLDEWLKRRLENTTPITPIQLSRWLRNMQNSLYRYSENTLAALKQRFEQEPSLFEVVFGLLANTVSEEKRSFWPYLAHDLRQLLPAKVWPLPQSEFFLDCAEKEDDPERAGDLFRMYLSCFPTKGVSVALTEAGFDFLGRRHDVASKLGDWQSHKLDLWPKDRFKRREQKSHENSANRAQTIANLAPRITTLREGVEEGALAWAAVHYLGLFDNFKRVSGARERLVSLTNIEIADAFIEGFIRYTENATIPKKEMVIESWCKNSIPYTHILLSLAVFLRLKAGMSVPIEALPHCIAAVVTRCYVGENVPGYNETLTGWVLQQAIQNPVVMTSVLKDIWVSSASIERKSLPAFSELSQDPGSQQFLTSLSADVLKAGINEASETVRKLLSVLLSHDQRTALAIGEIELDRNELSMEVRAIWITALFLIDPNTYLELWNNLMTESQAVVWEAIEFIRGSRYEKREEVNLTPAQHMEIIAAVGSRFPNVVHPPDEWSGSKNPWDASKFVANQIRLLAADISTEVGAQLERLENDDDLESYHDLIRHHRAQHDKQRRESSFAFASSEQVAQAILNHAPATPNDLLAFIGDHFLVLAREIARTQRERYRAYWNENGRVLLTPKREEVCSGLLAEDLQNRVRTQDLVVTVEHHMVADKECDLMVLQGTERLLPIEVKHHFNAELWTAWRTQLDCLYTREAKAGGLGIYLVLWTGEAKGRMMPKLPDGIKRPTSAVELQSVLESLIPEVDRHRLKAIVVDISGP